MVPEFAPRVSWLLESSAPQIPARSSSRIAPRPIAAKDIHPYPRDLKLRLLSTIHYVLGFCRSCELPTDNIRLIQREQTDPTTHMVTGVTFEIELPPDFPERYKPAVIRVAEQCKVKKHLEHPPLFEIKTTVPELVLS